MSEASANQHTTGKSRRKKWILSLAAVLALSGGAAAATHWYLLGIANGSSVGDARFRAAATRPSFVALEQFTVNLADDGGERFAQVALTLEVSDEETGAAIKARMPSVRNTILLLLSSKRTEELLTVDGKRELASQIMHDTGAQLGWPAPVASASGTVEVGAGNVANPVRAVHFSHFIVQ